MTVGVGPGQSGGGGSKLTQIWLLSRIVALQNSPDSHPGLKDGTIWLATHTIQIPWCSFNKQRGICPSKIPMNWSSRSAPRVLESSAGRDQVVSAFWMCKYSIILHILLSFEWLNPKFSTLGNQPQELERKIWDYGYFFINFLIFLNLI